MGVGRCIGSAEESLSRVIVYVVVCRVLELARSAVGARVKPYTESRRAEHVLYRYNKLGINVNEIDPDSDL